MVFIIHIDRNKGFNVAPPPFRINNYTEEGVTNDTLLERRVS